MSLISLPASPHAAPRPRVEHHPADVVETLGPLVGEIASLAGLPPDPWQAAGHDIMMSLRSDGNWAAADYAEWVGRQQGKTGGIGVPRLLTGLLMLPERLFLWSAHEYRTSTETFEMVREALLNLGDEVKPDVIEIPPLDIEGALDESLFVKITTTNGKEGFRTWTRDRRSEWRKRALFVARTEKSGRGFPADVRFIDETLKYTPVQQAAMAPTRLAKPFSQTIYLSSPPLRGDEGQVMYRLQERAVEEKDPRVGYRDWGLATTLDDFAKLSRAEQDAFLYNREHWAAALPALGHGRVTAEGVEHLIREFADRLDAAREVLGLWPRRVEAGRGWPVIAERAWRSREDPARRPPDGPVAFAAAAAWPDAAFAAIAVAGRRDGELVVQVLEHRAGTSWVIPRLRELAAQYNAPAVIDEGGPAGHLIAPLEEPDDGAWPVEVVKPTMRQVGHASKDLLAAIDGDAPSLRHFDQPELNAAAAAADRRSLGDLWTWQRRGDTDISPLEAVTLAAWLADALPPALEPVAVGGSSTDGVARTGELARMGF